MTADPALLAARARVVAAKARLDASIAEAKARLNPRTLAGDAVDGVKAKAGDLARDGVDAVRARPALTAALAGAVGLFLARKPILERIAAARGDATATSDES